MGEGEPVRKKLLEAGLLDKGHRIRREGDDLLIPVMGGPEGMTLEHADLERVESKETDYRALVDVPDAVRDELPSSFDIIGDVAVLRLSAACVPYAGRIAAALVEAVPSVRTVALDRGVKGECRIRDLELIIGEGTATMHVEYGVRMAVDPSKAYFNPRLANERHRIAGLVEDDEVVVDMFAGVGPFALMIARHARPEHVYAIDINPSAIDAMWENIALNHVDRVEPILGDARDVVPRLPVADRVIMNLPHSAHDFLDLACDALKEGGTAHLYVIAERDEMDGILVDALRLAPSMRVSRMEELKSYSPTMAVYAIDLVKAS